MKSASLKALAEGLSIRLGYKVVRSTRKISKKRDFSYGGGVDKLTQYRLFEENDIQGLTYTTDCVKVEEWLANGKTVVGRKLLNASCGKGIVLISADTPKEMWQNCRVFTLYQKKKQEFRVHVCKGEVVSVVEKRKRKDFDAERETKIRNLANGYVFCHENVQEPEGLRALAKRAAALWHSDFVGVDIGYHAKKNLCFVIEVNSAPGIQGTNLERYIERLCNV